MRMRTATPHMDVPSAYNWQNERLVIVDAPSRLPIDDVPAFAAVLWAAHDAPLPYRGFRGGDCSDSDM
ncbi:hypothetical protein [Mycobacteroides chelonae]|uniref:hypothetical protein n=1 Tax=Mycobacteroides chelonae TaxID=1774 RepID=UPI000F4EC4FD|nr:hypothetical protein [Mycobacteroides chelonae]